MREERLFGLVLWWDATWALGGALEGEDQGRAGTRERRVADSGIARGRARMVLDPCPCKRTLTDAARTPRCRRCLPQARTSPQYASPPTRCPPPRTTSSSCWTSPSECANTDRLLMGVHMPWPRASW